MVDLEDLLPIIERIARQVSSDFPDVSSEDLYQQMCLFVLQNAKSIKTKEEGGNPGWILRRVAYHYAKQERTQQLSMSIQYTYRPSDIKAILEIIYDISDLEKTPVPEDAISLTGNDSLEIGSDVRSAIKRLSETDQIALFRRYALKEIPDNSSYERKQLNKAVKNLVFALNSYRGYGTYVGKRRVLSNATAQAVTSNDW